MKLRTKIPVEYTNSINTLTTGIVEGIVIGCNEGFKFGYEAVFNYEYKSEDGYILSFKFFPLNKEEINGLYLVVKSKIPTNLSYTETTEYLYLLGMRVKMAETFGITTNDIEIIL